MTATAPSTALIGLGANLGVREAALNAFVQSLHATPDSQVLAVSDWIATAAVGGPEGQPDFLNGAALIQTQQSPKQLLESLQSIELALGRQRQTRWEAR
ncbi:MAG: 2-amino-4-hydroxy-6-hydroxymethyldihydropteridine diphosphokinase, partial [Planctomycetales bacterium]|nr:2-amino-4-hydroxy-6-hydroxymethyldihydropteridine diphosphokinase [Planctomycetales bacterium]